MTLSTSVPLKWGDGEYVFTLRLAEIEELQRQTDAAFGRLYMRVLTGEFFIRDIRETIRLGLIGGGVAPVRANELVQTYVDGQPLAGAGDPSSPLATATAILQAVIEGVPKDDDPEGKPEAGTQTDSSTSRQSAPTSSKRKSRRAKSAE